MKMEKINRIDIKRQSRSNTWLTVDSSVSVEVIISSFEFPDLIISSEAVPPMSPIATASMISLRWSSFEICWEQNEKLNPLIL